MKSWWNPLVTNVDQSTLFILFWRLFVCHGVASRISSMLLTHVTAQTTTITNQKTEEQLKKKWTWLVNTTRKRKYLLSVQVNHGKFDKDLTLTLSSKAVLYERVISQSKGGSLVLKAVLETNLELTNYGNLIYHLINCQQFNNSPYWFIYLPSILPYFEIIQCYKKENIANKNSHETLCSTSR